MQCFEIRELFRDYVDGALSKEDQQVLREHLARCSVCERELRMYDHVVVSLASLPPVEPPAGLRDRLHDAIEREADRQHAAARSVAHPRRFAAAAAVGALAAAIVLLVGYIWIRVTTPAGGPSTGYSYPERIAQDRASVPEELREPERVGPPTEPPAGNSFAASPDVRRSEALRADRRIKDGAHQESGLMIVEEDRRAPDQARPVPVRDTAASEIAPAPPEPPASALQPPSVRVPAGEFVEHGPTAGSPEVLVAESPAPEEPIRMGPAGEESAASATVELRPHGTLRAGQTGEVEISIWVDEGIPDAEIVVNATDGLRVVGATDEGQVYKGELKAGKTSLLIDVSPGQAGSAQLSAILRWDRGKRIKRSAEMTVPILSPETPEPASASE